MDTKSLETKSTSKGNDFAGTVMAILIVIAALAAIGYFVMHIASIMTAVLYVVLGFIQAVGTLFGWRKQLARLGAKPWVNNKWTWLVILLLGAAGLWFVGKGTLYPFSLVLFLRLFITPDKTDKSAVGTIVATKSN